MPLGRKLDLDGVLSTVNFIEHLSPEALHERGMRKDERHVVVHQRVEEARDQLRAICRPERGAKAVVSVGVLWALGWPKDRLSPPRPSPDVKDRIMAPRRLHPIEEVEDSKVVWLGWISLQLLPVPHWFGELRPVPPQLPSCVRSDCGLPPSARSPDHDELLAEHLLHLFFRSGLEHSIGGRHQARTAGCRAKAYMPHACLTS